MIQKTGFLDREDILLRAYEKMQDLQDLIVPILPETGEELNWILEEIETELHSAGSAGRVARLGEEENSGEAI